MRTSGTRLLAGARTAGHQATVGELVEQCRQGSEDAWCELVTRHERLVYSIARRAGLEIDDASDVTQAVFLSLFDQLDSVRDHERLDAWLATVTRRLAWRHRRRSTRYGSPSDDLDDLQSMSNDLDRVEISLDVHQAVASLSEPCRTLVTALFLEPAPPSYAQIAVRIGRPVGSIGPLRGRCLLRLRDEVDGVRQRTGCQDRQPESDAGPVTERIDGE